MAWYELFPKEWTATHDGHSIRVHNSWTTGMQLYVDDKRCAGNNRLFALNKKKPFLRYEFPRSSGGSSIIEVFAYALFCVKAKIVVDGAQIAGDTF